MPLSLKASVGDDGLLKRVEECSTLLRVDFHNPVRYLQRGLVYSELGYPDLAAADAYYALSLLESVIEPDGCDYPARKHPGPLRLEDMPVFDSHSKSDIKDVIVSLNIDEQNEEEEDDTSFEPLSYADYLETIDDVYLLLVKSLARCGCWRDAYEFCMQALKLPEEQTRQATTGESLTELLELIKQQVPSDGATSEFNPARLDRRGNAKRVVYPWNTHEPDRNSPEIARLLNERLQKVAPKCEVRAVELPSLHDDGSGNEDPKENSDSSEPKISIQLGLFAKENIAPGETLLHETSLLTATNRLHDDICDACNGPLPPLSSENPPRACACCLTVFCTPECHDAALESYHDAICGREGFELVGKDIQDQKDKADYLYLLLLARTIAMSATQRVHPLDLPEVKYIWGDFHDLEQNKDTFIQRSSSATLPFSLQLNIIQPMRLLDEMGADPYKALPMYNTWVFNTLYAKFRGTASGRLSTWDGAPEVCAVHPLWCLANHSCDPNVRWEWGGEVTFMARSDEERVKWGPEERQVTHDGIKKDEEILNHYCDLDLKVKDRREWAMGALGGSCQCERCVWEASQTA